MLTLISKSPSVRLRFRVSSTLKTTQKHRTEDIRILGFTSCKGTTKLKRLEFCRCGDGNASMQYSFIIGVDSFSHDFLLLLLRNFMCSSLYEIRCILRSIQGSVHLPFPL